MVSLRNSTLKSGSLHFQIYKWLKENPDSTRYEVSKGTGIPHDIATKRIAELKNKQLIKESGTKYCKYAGRNVGMLRVLSENEVGETTDRLVITLKIYNNVNGGYTATAIIEGEPHNYPATSFITNKTVKIDVPKHNKSLQTCANEKDNLIIDAKYEIID